MVIARPEHESMSCAQILDVDFLREQTAFDASLERELLGLLEQQCATLLPMLTAPEDSIERRDAAHSLRGAAAALGAHRLAAAATAIELGQRLAAPIDDVVAELCAVIRDRLAGRAA